MAVERLDTRATGIAAGAVAAGIVFLATLAVAIGVGSGPAPQLLRSVLFGFSVSPAGAFVGAMWAYVYGFLAGAAFAFLYNLASSPEPPPPERADRETRVANP